MSRPTPAKFRIGARVAAALAATVLTVSACAGDEGGGEAGDGGLTLNVGQISDSVAFFPLFVAETNGYFEDEGLTLGERPRLGTGAKVAAALQSGSIDVGAGVLTDALNLAKTNDATQVIGSLVNEYYVDITVSPDFDGPGPDAPLEEKIRALQGKNIGITGPGSGTEALVVYLFAQVGLDPSTDATLVNLGAQATAAVGALQTGRVDALAFFQPIGEQAVATSVGEIYISPARGDVPDLAGALHGTLFTTSDKMEDSSDAMAAFLRAIARAEAEIQGDPAQVEELLQAYQTNLNPETVSALTPILQEEIPEDPSISEEAYQVGADFHRESGLFPDPPAYSDLIASDFLEQALSDGGSS